MHSLKVHIIGPAYPLRGGLASYNERLAKEFSAYGHDVTIYTFSLQYPNFLFPGKTQYSTGLPPEGIKIKVVINSINPFNWITVGRKIAGEKPDLIIVRYWLPFMGPALGTILRIAKKNKQTKVVCIADNIIPHEKRPGDNAFTSYFIKPVDAFITMSEKVLSDLKKFNITKPAKYVAHPLYDNFGNAVTTAEARNKLNIPSDKKILLFFGFIRKYKGLDILFDAMKIIKERYDPLLKDVMLLVAGEFYEDEKPYNEQIEQLNIRDRLILRTEFIADEDVKYFLCAADVVVQPYRNATQSGVTPLAYHFEIPMIVTNVGGLPDLVPPGVGLLAEPNAEAIADQISAYFLNRKEHFLPALREEKKKYSWEVMMESIIGIGRSGK